MNSRIRSALALALSSGVARDRRLDDPQLRHFEVRVEESIQLAQGLADEQPGAPQFQYLVGQLRHKHGTLLLRLGQRVASEASYRDARATLCTLESSFPEVPVFALRRAFIEQSLARLLIESQESNPRQQHEASQLLASCEQTLTDLQHQSADSGLQSRLQDVERLADRLNMSSR